LKEKEEVLASLTFLPWPVLTQEQAPKEEHYDTITSYEVGK